MLAEKTSGNTLLTLTESESKSLLALVRLALEHMPRLRETGLALRKERSLTGAAAKLAFLLQEELEIATGERLRRAKSRRRIVKQAGLE